MLPHPPQQLLPEEAAARARGACQKRSLSMATAALALAVTMLRPRGGVLRIWAPCPAAVKGASHHARQCQLLLLPAQPAILILQQRSKHPSIQLLFHAHR